MNFVVGGTSSPMNMTVEILRIILGWPVCFLAVMLFYRKAITTLFTSLPSLLPGAKIKFTIGQFSLELPIPELEKSITESLLGEDLTTDQISLLMKLSKGSLPLEPSSQYISTVVRPIRNAGLIRVPGGGFLQNGADFAKAIELTTLGRYVVEAAQKNH